MTMDLHNEQFAVYQAIKQISLRSFVRICKEDHALWVSDLPRHTSSLPQLMDTDVLCWTDSEKKLLYLDWTEAGWRRRMDALPASPPALPVQESLHSAYALCRFLLLHPAELTANHLPFLRRMIKALDKGNPEIQLWHEQAAQALRAGKPMASCAGRLLAEWIAQQEEKE